MSAKQSKDDYETRFMSDGGRTLVREKLRFPAWMNALLFLGPVLGMGVLGFTGELNPIIAAILLLPMVFIWATLSSMRAVVSEQFLHIQYGFVGPKIDVNKIESVEAMDYNMLKYGGFGVRRGLDGSHAYSVPGAQGKGLNVRYVDDKGKTRSVFFSTKMPMQFLDAIRQAQAGTLAESMEERSALDAARITQGRAASQRAQTQADAVTQTASAPALTSGGSERG